MGLAASQARLLTITARLADNELRSQTINNAKMRLATQSAQASEKYVNALNESNMMFQNTMLDGSYQNQLLTFNSLTSYSPYNTQYGLANAAGLALVSEAEANMFVASGGNLEKYLNLHGLEWGTTYFDHVYDSELQAAMGEDYGVIFGSIDGSRYGTSTVEEYLKAAYEHYEAYEGSLEYAQFNESSQNFLAELRNYNIKYEKWILGEQYGSEGARLRATQIISNMMSEFDPGTEYENGKYYNPPEDPNSQGNIVRKNFMDSYSGANNRIIAYIIKNLSDEFLLSYYNKTNPPSTGNIGDLFNSLGFNSMDIFESGGWYGYTGTNEDRTAIVIDPTTGTFVYGNGDGKEDVGDDELITIKGTPGAYYIDSCADGYHKDNATTVRYESESGDYKQLFKIDNTTNELYIETYYKDKSKAYQAIIQEMMTTLLDSSDVTFDFFSREDSSLVDLGGVIAGMDPETQREEIMNYLRNLLASGTDNEAFMSKMRHLAYIEDLMALYYDTDGNLINTGMIPSDEMQNIFDMYRVECMISVYGEPKYSWIDKNDTGNTGNPDSKAQWLTNLFERMKRGYRILEDGLASSNEWIEFALKSGLVTVEQVDSSYNWVNIDYKTCAGITEQTDRSAIVAKAEAEYNRAMNDIKQKDSIYDLQLKNIDTEHSSLQQEYDSIQKVINKNIERTMKFDQNG